MSFGRRFGCGIGAITNSWLLALATCNLCWRIWLEHNSLRKYFWLQLGAKHVICLMQHDYLKRYEKNGWIMLSFVIITYKYSYIAFIVGYMKDNKIHKNKIHWITLLNQYIRCQVDNFLHHLSIFCIFHEKLVLIVIV